MQFLTRGFGMAVALCASAGSGAFAQQSPADGEKNCRPTNFFELPTYKSVEQLPDQRVTFRFCGPEAEAVFVTSVDVVPINFGSPTGLAMTKDDTGLWTVTTPEPLPAATYRYNFMVAGARVPNPLGTDFVRDRAGVNSVFEVKGPEGAFQSYNRNVPHGAVTEITYWSDAIGAPRTAQVYTPPGYMKGNQSYPVLYLVHGAGDSDEAWLGTGHAHYILDNLIAAGKAKPMIVVMPFGHTPVRYDVDLLINTDFGEDLTGALIPYVETNFRTLNGPENRAMAGLSMGGAHTMRYGLTRPDLFRYVGIFSMGLFRGEEEIAAYEQAHAEALRRSAGEMKLVYYAMGKDDFLYQSAAPTLAMFEKHGLKPIYNETEGGHVWSNWRLYLQDFAPRLFR